MTMLVERMDSEDVVVRKCPGGDIVLRAAMRSESAYSVFAPGGELVASITNEQPWALRMLAEAKWTRDMLDAALTLHGFVDQPDRNESEWTPGQGMDPIGRGHGHW